MKIINQFGVQQFNMPSINSVGHKMGGVVILTQTVLLGLGVTGIIKSV